MFALIGASILVIVAIGLFKEQSWAKILFDLQILTLNSFLAPILTYGIIGLTEMVFEITTDLTLIELLDYDRPLLKRAQRETNGTFNHSIVVGNLAEACATAIGAHSLLCRVGAYYHDIGKMIKPDYFIENQYIADNKHDKIKPTMSAKIIRNHVNDGLKHLVDSCKHFRCTLKRSLITIQAHHFFFNGHPAVRFAQLVQEFEPAPRALFSMKGLPQAKQVIRLQEICRF